MPSGCLFGPVAAVAIGILNTSGVPVLMCLSVLVPALCGVQRTRRRAACTIGCYYLGCTWPAVVVLYNFEKTLHSLPLAPAVCIVAACLLAIPFVLAWSPARHVTATTLPLALAISAVPPLGIICVGSPLAAAGLLFPGSMWLGLVLIFALPAGLLLRPRFTAIGVTILVSLFHARFAGPAQPPETWTGINTRFDCPGPRSQCDFERLLAVQRRATESTRAVLVFPEAAVPNWTDATELFWRDINEQLRQQGVTVLVGATVPQGRTTRNVILVRGAERGIFDQRVPAPIGMWRPFTVGSVPMNLAGPATLVATGHRAAVLICYEQFVPWTWVSAMLEHPSVVVAISNDEWSAGTPLPRYRDTAARSWSTLFGLPLISSTNE